MRRVLILVVLATAVVAVAFAVAFPDRTPELHFDSSVPDDLRAVAVEAWDGFLKGLGGLQAKVGLAR